MNENIQYAIHDQLERIADGLESLGAHIERLTECLAANGVHQGDAPDFNPATSAPVAAPPLSLFFESLPTWVYNHMRRKTIPVHLAARIIGLHRSQLVRLTEIGLIKGKNGRYDLVELLGYLEDVFSEYERHEQVESGPVFKQ